jgi:hypothetical protein
MGWMEGVHLSLPVRAILFQGLSGERASVSSLFARRPSVADSSDQEVLRSSDSSNPLHFFHKSSGELS